MANQVTEPDGLVNDVAAYFGATSPPDLASPDAGRADDHEAVQADVNTYFGVEAAR